MDQLDTQIRIMRQSNAMQEAIQDLHRWENEMKEKEKFTHQTVATNESFDSEFPIRSHVTPSASNTPQNASTNEPPLMTKQPATTMKTQSALEKANEFKVRGNDCVKAGQFQKAIHYYTEAIRLNKFDPIYFSNRAQCYLKLNRFLECVEDCTIAIGMDENYVKAYYRRMQAHEQLDGNLTAALNDCETVLRFEPKNSGAKKCLERIKRAIKDQTAAVSKRQIENKNILLRASNDGDKTLPVANASTVEMATAWSKYEGQNDYERIDFISKPPHLRSKQSLKRIKITETTLCTENGTGGDRPLIQEVKSESHEKATVDEPDALAAQPIQPGLAGDIENLVDVNDVKIEPIQPGPAGDSKKVVDVNDVKIEKKTSVQQTSLPSLPPPTPKSTAQFHKIWSSTNSDQQKYAILKSIYNANVDRLLGSQFEVGLLAEILIILKHHFVPEQQPIVNIMRGIVNNMEMSIVALLMSDEDKLSFTKLIVYMRSRGEDANEIDAIERKFESYTLAPN